MAMDAGDADGLATVFVQAVRCGAYDYAEKFLAKVAGGGEEQLKSFKAMMARSVLEIMKTDEDWGNYDLQVKGVATAIERFRNGTNPGN